MYLCYRRSYTYVVCETYKQVQGKAEDGQINDPKYGLTHNPGGIPSVNVTSIVIAGLWH